MTSLNLEIVASSWQGADLHLMARVYKVDANFNKQPVTPADIASITYQIINLGTSAVMSAGSFTPASAILGILSKGTIWDRDSKGFNFYGVISAASLTKGATHRIVVTFTTTGNPARTGVVTFRVAAG